jgi:hypothetical protein
VSEVDSNRPATRGAVDGMYEPTDLVDANSKNHGKPRLWHKRAKAAARSVTPIIDIRK